MSSKKQLKILKKNRIDIFKQILTDDELNDLLLKYNIKMKLFLNNFLILFYDDFIEDFKAKSFQKRAIENNISFLFEKNISIKEIFLILRIVKNSIVFNSQDKSCDLYIFNKNINFIYDLYIDYLFDSDLNKENNDNIQKILDENIAFLKIAINRNIIEVSNSFLNLFLYENKKELEHQSFDKFIKNDDNFEELLIKLEEKNNFELEIELIKKDNSSILVQIKGETHFDKEELSYFTLIFKDVSFKKNIEKHKKIFLEQSKLAAMGELISMIAHQWRQPLQTVSILVQKLVLTKTAQGYVDNEILEKSVKSVDEQLDYMSKTIDDFRNFFKPQSEKYICKLSSIVDKAIKFLHYLLTINNVDIRVEVINDIELEVHENNIIQVLINIIKNAKDVLVERNIENKFVKIRCDFNEKYAIIEIEDSAGGIKNEDMEKVFKSYFTTKDEDSGTGLGLYMSKIVIEEHSLGKLNVKNGKDGAIFRIELPLK